MAAIAALSLAACGDAGSPPRTVDPERPVVVESCEEISAFAFDVVQALLYRVADLTVTELLADPPPPALDALHQVNVELEARALELECSRDEVLADLRGRADELEVDSPVGELFFEVVREEFGIE